MDTLALTVTVAVAILVGGALAFVYLQRRYPSLPPELRAEAHRASMTQPVPADTGAAVEARRYASVAAFQADAVPMAAAGWVPVAQSETTGSVNGSWVGVAVLMVILGFLLWPPALIIALVAFVLAALARRKVLVVTYRAGSLPAGVVTPASPAGNQ